MGEPDQLIFGRATEQSAEEHRCGDELAGLVAVDELELT